jgi:hypothetical protein
MEDLLLRGSVGIIASLAAIVVYMLSAELAIALSISLAVALVVAAFVVKPVVLVGGASSRQSFLIPVGLATSMALGAIGAALSENPSGVVAFVLGLVALVVLLARSAAANVSSR